MLKRIVQSSALYPVVQTELERVRSARELWDWYAAGCEGPPPHRLKRRVIRSFARRFGARTLVETGTYLGGMIQAMRPHFDRIVSIEVDEALWRKAVARFRGDPRVDLRLGDSGEVLAKVLPSIDAPALFWLDGHFSGGVTSKGALDTPVSSELSAVLSHRVRGHVILIDDARLFDGTNDYPTLEAVREAVREARPDLQFDVRNDVIRGYPS